LYPRHRVGLLNQQVRVRNGVDGEVVEQERRAEQVREVGRGVEPELVDHVRRGVAGVVYLDLVQDVVVECVEVGPAGRLLQRNVVGNDGDRAGAIRAAEGVQVGVVSRWISADQRCLAVAGGEGRFRNQQRGHQGKAG